MSATASRAAGLGVEPFQGDAAEWDAFVHGCQHATFCHLAGWREIVRDVMGHEPRYAVARDERGAWSGVLPLAEVRSRLFGHYLVSMPFLNYGGPIGDDAARTRLAEWAARQARSAGADLLELRTRHTVASSLEVNRRKITVELELPADPETLWRDRFPAKLRNQIRRPLKAGMEVRFGADQLEAFYDVFARNMRDLGTPVLPRRLFRRLDQLFPDRVVFAAVYTGAGLPVAGGCGLVFRDEFEMTWASSLREHNREAPNMLLYWSFMREMIGRGIARFNFGRCTPGGGTHRFKRQWGGADVPLPWRQWSAAGADATPSPDDGVYGLATAVWRRLPLGLANRIGPALARRIP